jgi:hypothetical protein
MDTEKEVKPMNEAAAINETLHRVARKVHPLAQDDRQAIQKRAGTLAIQPACGQSDPQLFASSRRLQRGFRFRSSGSNPIQELNQ